MNQIDCVTIEYDTGVRCIAGCHGCHRGKLRDLTQFRGTITDIPEIVARLTDRILRLPEFSKSKLELHLAAHSHQYSENFIFPQLDRSDEISRLQIGFDISDDIDPDFDHVVTLLKKAREAYPKITELEITLNRDRDNVYKQIHMLPYLFQRSVDDPYLSENNISIEIAIGTNQLTEASMVPINALHCAVIASVFPGDNSKLAGGYEGVLHTLKKNNEQGLDSFIYWLQVMNPFMGVLEKKGWEGIDLGILNREDGIWKHRRGIRNSSGRWITVRSALQDDSKTTGKDVSKREIYDALNRDEDAKVDIEPLHFTKTSLARLHNARSINMPETWIPLGELDHLIDEAEKSNKSLSVVFAQDYAQKVGLG